MKNRKKNNLNYILTTYIHMHWTSLAALYRYLYILRENFIYLPIFVLLFTYTRDHTLRRTLFNLLHKTCAWMKQTIRKEQRLRFMSFSHFYLTANTLTHCRIRTQERLSLYKMFFDSTYNLVGGRIPSSCMQTAIA